MENDQNAQGSIRMKLVVRVKAGVDIGAVFELTKDQMIVGRSKVGMADIQIHDLYAAPRHFEIRWDQALNSHIIEGWGHPNPVYLNGAALSAHRPERLREGDEIRLGSTVFIYEHN